MITEQETKRYDVNTKRLIESSFTDAFDSNSDAPVVYPPEKSVMITGVFSMLMITGMCVLTFFELNYSYIWLAIGGIALAVIAFIIFRYAKALKKYKDANSAGSQRFDYKQEYVSLFPELPDRMSASAMTKAIAPMQSKLRRDVYNNALRDLITTLNTVNNPQDIICRNLSTYGELFAQPRRRCYLTSDNSKFVLYDADFISPKGELVVDAADIIGFGEPSKFDLSEVKKSGSKISSEAVIIAVKTGDDSTLFLEAHSKDVDKLKKLFGKARQL